MRHVSGEDRSQRSLLPDSLEDFVGLDHPVRVIDKYIDSLDVEDLGFSKAVTKATGRKPYHPGDLLKLYVYGYLNRLNTSRRLEAECHRNIELMWLMKRLAPDHKTIADFRKDNGAAIRRTCRRFIQFCRDAQLLTGRLVAIDGSKFQAAASKDQMLTRGQLKRDRDRLQAHIEQYLSQLDAADAAQSPVDLDRGQVEAALERLEAKVSRLDERERAMDELGGNQHCATEPDARLMRSGRDGMVVGYNVQSAVESETGLIVHHEVSDDSGDSRLLQPMAEQAKAALGAEELDVLADAGYANGGQQAACEEQGINVTVPRRVTSSSYPEFFQKSDFEFDAQKNQYRCPAGKILAYSHDIRRRKLKVYKRTGCRGCPLQPNCTPSPSDQRSITRNFHEATFDGSEARIAADPNLMNRRMAIAERPFAMLKHAMALKRFVCRGKDGARSEIAIGVLSYNLKRMINEVGVQKMLALI